MNGATGGAGGGCLRGLVVPVVPMFWWWWEESQGSKQNVGVGVSLLPICLIRFVYNLQLLFGIREP